MSETTSEEATLAAESLAMCKQRGWSLHWTARGAYLHLEASELIESLRGKGTSTPTEEAGDVLLVLMSITENAGIPWADVIAACRAKVERFKTRPRYAGEEYDPALAAAAEARESELRAREGAPW